MNSINDITVIKLRNTLHSYFINQLISKTAFRGTSVIHSERVGKAFILTTP